MAYTRTRRSYGSRGYNMMSVFTPDGGATNRPWILCIPGGGWGYRSAYPWENPTNGASPSFFAGSLANALSAYADTYVVFVAQVASNSHQGTAPASLIGIGAWEDGEAVAFGDKRAFAGQTYVAKQAHTAAVANQPSGDENDHWERVVREDCGQPLIANRGEQQNGYGFQAVADIRQAMAYIMQHAGEFGIDPNKSAIWGESAGAFDAARFVTMGSAPFAHGDHPSSSHPLKAARSTMPKAAIIGIGPTHIDQYVRTDRGGSQGAMRSFLTSIYGRPEIAGFNEWDALPSHIRRGIDPLRNMSRTGVSVPTYIDHAFDSNIADPTNLETGGSPITDADVFEGFTKRIPDPDNVGQFVDVEAGPNPHHSRNGWRFFKDLVGPRVQNRQARTDCVFVQKGLADNTIETFTNHGDYGGTGAVTSVPAPVVPVEDGNGNVTNQAAVDAGLIARKRVVGDQQIAWLNARLGV